MTSERFKRVIAVLIAGVTTLAAILAFLQSDASFRDDQANRDTKLYSLEALGFQVAGDARANFEFNSVYQAWDELDSLAFTAEDDPGRAQLYEKVKAGLEKFSPLFDARTGYFDAKAGAPDYSRFEAETYVRELEGLVQKYKAASKVKDAWDAKANTYIVHLTLLAVALFLFGLSLTVDSRMIQRLFAGVGLAITLVATSWAIQTWASPVEDLRQHPQALEAYARGVALAHRGLDREAAAEFDQALKEAPDFADALAARGEALHNLEKYPEAVRDLQAALGLAPAPDGHLEARLGDAFYNLGQFPEALAAYRRALEVSPDELYVRFSLALALLASGEREKALAEYRQGMDRAAGLVREAAAAGLAAPADVWEGLDMASADVDALCQTVESGEGCPPRDRIQGGDEIVKLQEALVGDLDGLSTALEYTGKPPQGTLQARIGDLYFGEPIYDEDGNVTEVRPVEDDDFPNGTSEVAVDFDYEGMKDGQDVVVKVFQGTEEQPSWRIVERWKGGPSGSWEYSLTPGYTDTFAFQPDSYTVEIFVDGHMANRSSFTVQEEEAP